MATEISSLAVSTINNTGTEGTLTDANSTNSQLGSAVNYYAYVKVSNMDYQSLKNNVVPEVSNIETNIFGPLTDVDDSEWQFAITTDGWFKFEYIAAPLWEVGSNYNQYDVVYDDTDDQFYKANAAVTSGGSAPSGNASWDLINSPSNDPTTTLIDEVGTATESGNLYYQVFDTILTPKTSIASGNKTVAAARESCGNCTRGEDVEVYEFLIMSIDAMEIARSRGQYVNGELIARKAATFI